MHKPLPLLQPLSKIRVLTVRPDDLQIPRLHVADGGVNRFLIIRDRLGQHGLPNHLASQLIPGPNLIIPCSYIADRHEASTGLHQRIAMERGA